MIEEYIKWELEVHLDKQQTLVIESGAKMKQINT